MLDLLYESKMLVCHEYDLHRKARAAVGKQNYMRIAPEKILDLTTALDKERLEVIEVQVTADQYIGLLEELVTELGKGHPLPYNELIRLHTAWKRKHPTHHCKVAYPFEMDRKP